MTRIIEIQNGQCVLPIVEIVPAIGEEVSFATYDYAVGETDFAGVVQAVGHGRARVCCGPEQVFLVPVEMLVRQRRAA